MLGTSAFSVRTEFSVGTGGHLNAVEIKVEGFPTDLGLRDEKTESSQFPRPRRWFAASSTSAEEYGCALAATAAVAISHRCNQQESRTCTSNDSLARTPRTQ